MTDAPRVLTIRVVKSLEYRNIKNLILHGVDLDMKTIDFKQYAKDKIQTTAGFLPYRNVDLNAMKIFFIPHKQKPNNLTINLDNDEGYFLKDDLSLSEQGVVYETEISFFNLSSYENYKANPVDKCGILISKEYSDERMNQ